MTDTVLSVRELDVEVCTPHVRFTVVNGLSLDIEAGKAVGLVGESGSGKSMTALAITQLLPRVASIRGGSVRLGVRELIGLRSSELRSIRGVELAMIFQDPATFLNPLMRIGKQVVEALLAHGGMSQVEADSRALRALEEVHIAEPHRVFAAYPHELSGGMRQRVVIATALITRPALVIADEPTTALDVTTQAQVMALLTTRRREVGAALLLITHDLGLVAEYCERAYIMYAGNVVESGDVKTLLTSPAHPYTRALLRSTLSVDRRLSSFAAIGGQPADLRHPPSGCRFHPRCPERVEGCELEAPPLVSIADGAQSRCWLCVRTAS